MCVETSITKKRLLLLQKFLYEETDEQHPVSVTDMLDYLKDYNIDADRKTVRRDISAMIECGFDIITADTRPNKYFWGTRTLDHAEIKLIADAVLSCGSLSARKSEIILNKLSLQSDNYGRKVLKKSLGDMGKQKTNNENVVYTVDTIDTALAMGEKIGFTYMEYTSRKEKVARNSGEKYILSPFFTTWKNDYYYVVGFCENTRKISRFRIDRIGCIELIEEKPMPKPKGFGPNSYSFEAFEHFIGTQEKLKLKCRKGMMDHIIDRYDEDIKVDIVSENEFYVYVEDVTDTDFFSWLFALGGAIVIVSPEKTIHKMVEFAERMLSEQMKIKVE